MSPREGLCPPGPALPTPGWLLLGIPEEQLDRRRCGGAGEGRAGRSPARDPRLVPRGLVPQTFTDVGGPGRASLSSSQRFWGAWPWVWAAGGGDQCPAQGAGCPALPCGVQASDRGTWHSGQRHPCPPGAAACWPQVFPVHALLTPRHLGQPLLISQSVSTEGGRAARQGAHSPRLSRQPRPSRHQTEGTPGRGRPGSRAEWRREDILRLLWAGPAPPRPPA